MTMAPTDDWTVLRNHLASNVLAPPNKTYLTSADLIQDVDLLADIFPPEKLRDPDASLWVGWIVGQLVENPTGVPWHWQALHCYAEIVRQVSHLPGWPTLRQRLPSHRGFENQLLATFFLHSHCSVQAIEDAILGVEADIEVRVDETPAFVEVKTIDQSAKQTRMFQAVGSISTILHNECPKAPDGKSLSLVDFDGVVPKDISIDGWRRLLLPLPMGPEARRIDLGQGYVVNLEFGLSGQGRIRGLNVFRNLDCHLAVTEERIPVDSTSGALFLAVVPVATIWELRKHDFSLVQRYFEARKVLGLLFLGWVPGTASLNFTRLGILKTAYSTDQVATLERALPIEWRFPYEKKWIS